ncbi:MAG: hypothetical protein HKL90_05840 [Elusimicrobia bacterium]|nr:hypothetical protein [Elusimicrobiota bacterium]
MRRRHAAATGIALLTALLLHSPAHAAAKVRKKHSAQALNPVAARLMSAGLADLNHGDLSAAISLFAHAARRQPSVQAYFLLGWAHYQRGFKSGAVESADRADAQSAVDAYAMALKRDPKLSELPDHSRLYFSLGLCEESLGAHVRALNAYKLALAAAPDRALIALNAARLRLKMKEPGRALSNARMALIKARAAGQEGELRAAAAGDPLFASLRAAPKIRAALGVDQTLIASANTMRDSDLRDSVGDGPRAVTAPRPASSMTLDIIARADEDAAYERYAEAARGYRAALISDQHRRALSAEQTASLWEKLGVADEKIGDDAPAVAALRRSLELAPGRAETRYRLALAYAASGRTSAALTEVRNAFAAASSNVDELRRYVLLSKTDLDLTAVRDLPGYRAAVAAAAPRIALR